MYVDIHAYIHLGSIATHIIHTYICTHIYIYIYIYIYTHTHSYIHTCYCRIIVAHGENADVEDRLLRFSRGEGDVLVSSHVHTFLSLSQFILDIVAVNTCIHTYIHTYIHTCYIRMSVTWSSNQVLI